MISDNRVYFLGAGAMAEAMIKGLLEQQVLSREQIMATDVRPERCLEMEKKYGIATDCETASDRLAQAAIIVLAFKPKDLVPALEAYLPHLHQDQLIISLLAGVTTERIGQCLPEQTPVVRAMPNTAAAVGLAATAICAGQHAKEEHMASAEALFAAMGIVQQVAEPMMDAVTGLSGSGPAYVYLLAEAMLAGGMAAGLDSSTARALTEQTLLGAARMLQVSNRTPAELRQQVSSPGGTTLAGLQALAEHHFTDAVQDAILRATERSRDLSRLATSGTN